MPTWVLVPGSPILLPGVGGSSDPAAELREACVAEIDAALSDVGAERVTVLAGGPATKRWPDLPYELSRLVGGPSTGSGGRQPGPGGRQPGPGGSEGVPLTLAVGRHLLRAAGWVGELSLLTSAAPRPVDAELVVAVGDGSLLRHEKGGPGPQHRRAADFDEQVRRAVQTGDPTALGALDVALAAELGVTGTVPWLAMAAAAGDHDVDASVRLANDPFGPYALVASWRWR